MANPLAAAMGKASLQSPQAEKHATSLHSPTEKAKRMGKGRPAVEMKRGHGARKSAQGRDMRMGNMNPPLPAGNMDVQPVGPGVMRFGDQGRGR